MLQKAALVNFQFKIGRNYLQNRGMPPILQKILRTSADEYATRPGKRSFGVNLKTKEGQDLVRKLVSQADVLVSFF
jgi:crotonobetainyl-CoA:carnitine CoA-transferase CaiB-like acyl-CoA transferase